MSKFLLLNDIVIADPKEQIKQEIKNKFRSIDDLAKFLGMDTYIVKKYLRQKKIGSKRFKNRLFNVLGKPYNEIVKSEEEQISTYVSSIFSNIRYYTSEQDLKTLNKLLELCKKYNIKHSIIKMYRNIAINYFFNNNEYKAIDIIELAIEKARTYKDINGEVYCLIELALMNIQNGRRMKAIDIVEKVFNNFIIEELNNDTKFKYYYTYGIIENNLGNYNRARRMFSKAIENSTIDEDKGLALSGIGLSYKNEGKYPEALNKYEEALNVLENIKDRMSSVYNNIANVYSLTGELDKALEYINLSLKLLNKNYYYNWFIPNETYFRILIRKGKFCYRLNEYINFIENSEDKFVCRKNIVNAVKVAIETAIEYKKINELKKLNNIILDYIKKIDSNDTELIDKFDMLYGKVNRSLEVLKLDSRGGM